MTNTINNLIAYLKYPVLGKDENTQFFYRFKILINLLFISIFSVFILTFITGIFEVSGLLESSKHTIDELMKNASNTKLFLLAVVFAPFMEECIFRAPLGLFKNPKTFRVVFYTIALLFGYMHLFNYEITKNILIFSPILVAPQIVIGLYLGFIRVRFGLIWSIALHALYNGFLLSLYLIAKDVIS